MGPQPNFSRSSSPSAVAPCQTPCQSAKATDDALSKATALRMQSISGVEEPAEGPPSLDGPVMYSDTATRCQKRAYTLGPMLRRFNRYRQALPHARAAADMNELGDKPGDKNPSDKPCLTRLSDDAGKLNQQLGLPDGTLRDEDLRNDQTGYRAALYRDEQTGRIIMVSRDTQPQSLVDWQTNTRNGAGLDTDQYKAARKLSSTLAENDVAFDLAGYSKGGGLAQEAGLMNPDANVYVFNSAGLNVASLNRTGSTDFNSLVSRTQSFSAENEFLTYMNETSDPEQQIRNAQFLRTELAGEGAGVDPIEIKYRNPADTKGKGSFGADRDTYLQELDRSIAGMQADLAAGRPVTGFPPVRAALKETVKGSGSSVANMLGANNDQPNLGKLAQHRMSRVLDPMEDCVSDDRKALRDFLRKCG